MMFSYRQKMATGLLIPILLLMVNSCAYMRNHVCPASKDSRKSVRLQPETIPPEEVKPYSGAVHPSKVKPVPESVSPASTAISDLSISDLYVHKVRWPGETLSLIAQWYTGSWKNWRSLAATNLTLNPNRIMVNDRILIPQHLLKTRKPLPLNYILSSVRKQKAKVIPPAHPAMRSDSTQLFEPIKAQQPSLSSDDLELFEPIKAQQPSLSSDDLELFEPTK